MKDLSWSCDWFVAGNFFGVCAVVWSGALLARAVQQRHAPEMVTGLAQLLWLVGNVVWMSGELHDSRFPDAVPVYDERMAEGGAVLKSALAALGVYYLFVKPLRLEALRPSAASEAEYDDTGLGISMGLGGQFYSRGLGICSWRELENLHMLFWLAKDAAWNAQLVPMWVLFAIPTVLLALDFCLVTWRVQGLCIENAHMLAQLVWVTANLVWAAGELWAADNDEASDLLSPRDGARPDGSGAVRPGAPSLRWVSALLLFLAFIPIIALHTHWLLCTRDGLVYRGGEGAVLGEAEPEAKAVAEAERADVDETQSPMHK